MIPNPVDTLSKFFACCVFDAYEIPPNCSTNVIAKNIKDSQPKTQIQLPSDMKPWNPDRLNFRDPDMHGLYEIILGWYLSSST